MRNYRLTKPGMASIIAEEAIVTVVYEDIDQKGVKHKANGIGNNDDTMRLDLVITKEQAIIDFKRNIIRFENVVNSLLTRDIKFNQFDAIVSRAFNRGVTGFREGEVELMRFVNEKDDNGVCIELAKDGNLLRRIHEQAMYVGAEYRKPEARLYEVNPKLFPKKYTLVNVMELL